MVTREIRTSKTLVIDGVERRSNLNEPKTESELYVLTELLKLVLRMSAEDRLKALWYTKGLADAREDEK